jgi:hypothetical protein
LGTPVTLDEIHLGRCYWYRFSDLPARRVFVDWGCPEKNPELFCCLDLETGSMIVLAPADFVRACDNEVEWWELTKMGPEHGFQAAAIPSDT